MSTKRKMVFVVVVLYACLGMGAGVASASGSWAKVVIDGNVEIVPETEESRAMLGMVTHPDGTIFLNTQRLGLYKSSDDGETWTASPVTFSGGVPAGQRLHGLGVSSSGDLYLAHQVDGSTLYMSKSTDKGSTWSSTSVDWANLNLTTNAFDNVDLDYTTFIEGPDGNMMASVELRYEETADYLTNGARCGLNNTMLRDVHGDNSVWALPSKIHQFTAETSLIQDPNDSDRMLAMTRIQRGLLDGENEATVMALTGCPSTTMTATGAYKNGILLESNDAGLTFTEVSNGMIGYYEMRGTGLWASNDVVVVAHQGAASGTVTGEVETRISLDGGTTWADGSDAGTSSFNASTNFELMDSTPGHSFTAPTVEISEDHSLTTYAHYDGDDQYIDGVFWHIERALVFYEGFDYTPTDEIDGVGGWSNSNDTVGVSATGLTYTGLSVSGGSAKYNATGDSGTGNFATKTPDDVAALFNSTDSVFDMSLLIGDTADPSNNSPHANLWLLRDDSGGWLDDGITLDTTGGATPRHSVHQIGTGEDGDNFTETGGTKLFVCRITMKDGDDDLATILNPNLSTLVDADFDSAATATGELTATGDDLDRLILYFAASGEDTLLDEIRIGHTLSSVIPSAPEPVTLAVLGLGGALAILLRRRRSLGQGRSAPGGFCRG